MIFVTVIICLLSFSAGRYFGARAVECACKPKKYAKGNIDAAEPFYENFLKYDGSPQ